MQGIWNGNDLQGVPFQRAQTIGARATLNDEEYAQRQKQRDALVESDHRDFDLEISEQFEARGTVGGACHEGNYTMFNILSGARADEKAAGQKR